jgi:uncharacterized protein
MRTSLKLAAICALSLLFVSGASLAKHPKAARVAVAPITQNYQPRPAIWKLSDSDTTIYLFGTTHALPKGFRWRSPAFNTIVKSADELVIETVDDNASDKLMFETFGELMAKKEARKPVTERVAETKRADLRLAIKQSEIPEGFLNMMPTWMVSFALSIGDMEAQGQSHDYGVESALEKAFRAARKPISAVEDGNAVLRNVNSLPEAAQVRMLEEAVDEMVHPDPGDAGGDHDWAKGNVAALDKDFTEAELGPELYDVLIRKRNTAWIAWLTQRLDKPGTVLFAVGAGHLAGPDSVLKLLSDKGLSTQRVQ